MMVSTQVLQEFYWIGMRKLGMEAPLARRAVQELSEGQVVVADRAIIAEAIDLSIVTGYTLWDALIIQAAVVGKCERLFTEDLQHGQIVKGVRIENPLLA